MSELSVAPMRRLAKKAGGDRISPEACKVLAEVLQEDAISICKQALQIMMHSHRKTLFPEDIRSAADKFRRKK